MICQFRLLIFTLSLTLIKSLNGQYNHSQLMPNNTEADNILLQSDDWPINEVSDYNDPPSDCNISRPTVNEDIFPKLIEMIENITLLPYTSYFKTCTALWNLASRLSHDRLNKTICDRLETLLENTDTNATCNLNNNQSIPQETILKGTQNNCNAQQLFDSFIVSYQNTWGSCPAITQLEKSHMTAKTTNITSGDQINPEFLDFIDMITVELGLLIEPIQIIHQYAQWITSRATQLQKPGEEDDLMAANAVSTYEDYVWQKIIRLTNATDENKDKLVVTQLIGVLKITFNMTGVGKPRKLIKDTARRLFPCPVRIMDVDKVYLEPNWFLRQHIDPGDFKYLYECLQSIRPTPEPTTSIATVHQPTTSTSITRGPKTTSPIQKQLTKELIRICMQIDKRGREAQRARSISNSEIGRIIGVEQHATVAVIVPAIHDAVKFLLENSKKLRKKRQTATMPVASQVITGFGTRLKEFLVHEQLHVDLDQLLQGIGEGAKNSTTVRSLQNYLDRNRNSISTNSMEVGKAAAYHDIVKNQELNSKIVANELNEVLQRMNQAYPTSDKDVDDDNTIEETILIVIVILILCVTIFVVIALCCKKRKQKRKDEFLMTTTGSCPFEKCQSETLLNSATGTTQVETDETIKSDIFVDIDKPKDRKAGISTDTPVIPTDLTQNQEIDAEASASLITLRTSRSTNITSLKIPLENKLVRTA